MAYKALPSSIRKVTLLPIIGTQQSLPIVTAMNQVISILKPKKLLKSLLESINVTDDLNKDHVNEILQKPLYQNNQLFQEYVKKQGFGRVLKCRLHDEKLRRANKQAQDSNRLSLMREENEDGQFIIKPSLVRVTAIKIENRFVDIGLSRRVKQVQQNREEEPWFELKQLRQENNKLKQKLMQASSTISLLTSKKLK